MQAGWEQDGAHEHKNRRSETPSFQHYEDWSAVSRVGRVAEWSMSHRTRVDGRFWTNLVPQFVLVRVQRGLTYFVSNIIIYNLPCHYLSAFWDHGISVCKCMMSTFLRLLLRWLIDGESRCRIKGSWLHHSSAKRLRKPNVNWCQPHPFHPFSPLQSKYTMILVWMI